MVSSSKAICWHTIVTKLPPNGLFDFPYHIVFSLMKPLHVWGEKEREGKGRKREGKEGKGDILLYYVLFRPSSRSHAVFQSQSFYDSGYPIFAAEGAFAIDTGSQLFEIWLTLVAVDQRKPVTRPLQWTWGQKGIRLRLFESTQARPLPVFGTAHQIRS